MVKEVVRAEVGGGGAGSAAAASSTAAAGAGGAAGGGGGGGASAGAPVGKRFEVRKWSAVALWSWEVAVDNCAICRNMIMDPCECPFFLVNCVLCVCGKPTSALCSDP